MVPSIYCCFQDAVQYTITFTSADPSASLQKQLWSEIDDHRLDISCERTGAI